MNKATIPCLLMLATLALSGCGKSEQSRKEEAVRCFGFMAGLGRSTQDIEHPSDFPNTIDRAGKGHPMGDQAKVMAFATLGQQLAGQMEATKSAAAQQDGALDYLRFQKASDAEGAATYVDACIANHDKLLAAAR
jgi:hypothetical protein